MIKVTPYNYTRFNTSFSKIHPTDETLNIALEELKNIEFDKQDTAFIRKLGSIPPYQNGKEAFDFIKNNNIKVKFAKLSSDETHAQWDCDAKTININEIYQNTKNRAVILAISEAIFHEAGHAKDLDSDSSIQEELDCLALNAMAHRALEKKYPKSYTFGDEKILQKGVILYADIYFDENQSRLIKKIQKSYSHLPAGDIKHHANNLALSIKYSNY